LFSWAGKYRTVDISSEDIRWCHAQYIASEMQKVHHLLQDWTPFSPAMPLSSMLEKLACIHGNLILIHPFRDGNGRTVRLLGDLLLMQSGRDPISHTLNDQSFRKKYYAAIRQLWISGSHDALIAILSSLIPA
jgi:cell filamentation protein